MADVRSLLRNERAQRRIDHAQATYSATGTLECAVCHIPLKSDQEVWNKHLKSTQHAMRQERLRLNTSRPSETADAKEASTNSKKRKADDEKDDSRKRTKPVTDISRKAIDDVVDADAMHPKAPSGKLETVSRVEPTTSPLSTSASTKPPSYPTQPTATIDEDEWAAFERDVATPLPDPSLPSALTAEATITAAPLTAAELAAQSREQASQQTKERREAEVEGENEDAARALEEEFDEMEGFEERVAKLRRMREELRVKRQTAEEEEQINEEADEAGGGDKVDDGDSESDDEYDLYGWGALGR